MVNEIDPEGAVAASFGDLLKVLKLSADDRIICQNRRTVESRLWGLASPDDPDHPAELPKATKANVRDRLKQMIECVCEIRTAFSAPQDGRTLHRTSRDSDYRDGRSKRKTRHRRSRDEPQIRGLSPSIAYRLSHKLADVDLDLRILLERASSGGIKGRPPEIPAHISVLQLAHCWKALTGQWPRASARDGRDIGAFAGWAIRTLRALMPDHHATRGPAWGNAHAPIKEALRWLQEEGLLVEIKETGRRKLSSQRGKIRSKRGEFTHG